MLVYKNNRRSLLWEPDSIFMHIPCITFCIVFYINMAAKSREFHMTSQRPCRCTRTTDVLSFGSQTLFLCIFHAYILYCFVHQYGRQVTWVNANLYFDMTFSLPSLISSLRRSIRAGRAARILEQFFCGALHNNAAKSANWRFWQQRECTNVIVI